MAKGAKKRKRVTSYEEDSFEDRAASRELASMKHRDLVIACVKRGIDFDLILTLPHPKLVGWFYNNYSNAQDPTRLVEYDLWRDEKQKEGGYDKIAPALRLAYVPEMEKLTKVVDVKGDGTVPTPKAPKKAPAQVDEATGVRAGTKKSLTYKLTDEGVAIAEIILKVKEQFPDAEEKSIKIWHKRRIKENQSKP